MTNRTRWALPLVVLAGLALRVYPWFLPHGFLGVLEQDDGVYYGAAQLLLHGQLPYRDVAMVHPPGSALLLAPFAALGGLLGDPIGMAAARVAIAAVAVCNTLLVHRVALRLPGGSRGAALAAAAVYALMPNAVIAEHTVLLEPLVNLACLLAVLLLIDPDLSRPAVLAAGALLAVAVSIKLFAAAYVVVVVLWLIATHRARLLSWLAGGVAAGAALTLLPFAAAAPHAFWQDVVVTQASRPQGAGRAGRLLDLAGFGQLPVALAVPLVVVLLALLASSLYAGSSPYRLLLGVLGLSFVAFVTSASYFPHYAAFLAPALAVVITARATPLRYAGLAVVLLAFGAGAVLDDAKAEPQGDLQAVGAMVPPGSCVFYEHVSVAIAADLFAPPSPACPAWLDGRGLLYSRSTGWPADRPFYYDGFTTNARWQAELRGQLQHADYLLIKGA
ncbi:MAG: hypothetical protein JWN31_1298, partial [Frankiales bacterium]|nr:hypothetical protein [Frankiales bacterium]